MARLSAFMAPDEFLCALVNLKGAIMESHLKLLGHQVRDNVTGFKGVVTSISFDIVGCIQGWVTPPVDKKSGAIVDGRWLDTARLTRLSKSPVYKPSDFTAPPGPEQKSAPRAS